MKKIIIITAVSGIVLLGSMSYFAFHQSRVKAPKSQAENSSALNTSQALKPQNSIVPGTATKKQTVPLPPVSSDQNKAILNVQSELREILALNQKINAVQTSKTSQILRIQEQALIHQRILNEIEKASQAANPAQPAREVLLAQEKLRIIREETLRNKKLLEDKSST